MLYMQLFLLCTIILQWNIVEGSLKKGVAHWADNYLCDDFKVLNNMTWWYDWRMSLNYFHQHHICESTIDHYKHSYVPMVWSYYSNTVINIDPAAHYILGFNEPNHRDQANLTPEQAASHWPDMERHSHGKPLVSPSAAPCGANCLGDTTDWFDKFFQHCTGCRIDFLATHAYYCNPDQTMHFLESLYHRYGKKIWLTEFACANTADPHKVLNYMKLILPRLEAAPYVYRYSWYMARIKETSGFVNYASSLLEPNTSTLTALGHFYNTFQEHGTSIIG